MVLFVFSITGCYSPNQDIVAKTAEIDSVSIWIQNAKNESINIENRKEALYNAYQKNNAQKDDSLKNRNISKIAYEGYRLKDSVFFSEDKP